MFFFFFSSRRRHTRSLRDWSSDVCSSDLHPVYSGVALGLYHGSVPHLLVLCHEAGRMEIEGAGGGPHRIPPLPELVELHERLALPARPARVAAVALNTRELDE